MRRRGRQPDTLVAALVAGQLACGLTAQGDGQPATRVGAVAPANTVAPVASGTVTIGGSVSTTDGTWSGAPAPTFAYQWKRAGVNIGGATASSYTLTSSDIGPAITCTVTATNSAGSASATSNALAYALTQTSPFTIHDAAAGITLNGSTVSAWADQSGNGKTLSEGTAANQMTFTASDAAFGGQPILTTAASTTKGIQAAAAADWKYLHDGTAQSVMVVGRTRGAAGNWMMGTQSSAGTTGIGWSLLSWLTNSARVAVGNGSAAIIDAQTASNTYSTTAGHVLVTTYRSGTNPDCVVRIDRVQRQTASEGGTPSASNPVGPLSIGYATNKTGGTDSDFALIVTWKREITAAEIADVEAYVLWRFGV